jgi:hypothetical protein
MSDQEAQDGCVSGDPQQSFNSRPYGREKRAAGEYAYSRAAAFDRDKSVHVLRNSCETQLDPDDTL